MSTITREQAQSVSDLKAGYTLGHADVAILNELARIALASLEAEPAIHRWRRVTSEPYGPYPWHYGDFIGFSKPVDGIEDEYFYSAPPAPISVPDEDLLHMAASAIDDLLSNKDRSGAGVWADIPAKLRRAAMLQGAEHVKGWIPCSERMPQKNERVIIFINFNSDTVPPSIHDAQFTGSTFRRGNATVNVFPLEDGYGVTHWMPLPAAPQQEVK
ncbi:DUF551 domain-containing protein [Enterobacter roggenkampii]|uniref:DUF551 domain-containing protein n=1 Tax=Enterobacter roggenkampii TaxID=1812935 RepID=UPI003219CAEE